MTLYRKILAPIIYLPSTNKAHYVYSKTVFHKFNYLSLKAAGKTKYYSTDGYNQEKAQQASNNFVTFEKMIDERRKEAERSIVVQVNSENSCSELYNYCEKLAQIKSIFYYKFKNNHFVLLEFTTNISVKDLGCYDPNGLNITSPFLWFKIKKGTSKMSNTYSSIPIQVGSQDLNDDIFDLVSTAESLTEEMNLLYEATKLSEIGLRLRMICARQIEMALSGLFPRLMALPFGSTVNSFGKEHCDLDINIVHNGLLQPNEDENERRLIYQTKVAVSSTRGQTQRHMELLGDILQIHVPGAVSVRKILGARVPIIKYNHSFAGVEIDISTTNMSSVYMSELLYLFGKLDTAAKPLVFTIKAWAKAVGLTSPNPGRWITNFSLTLLVIFFLQIKKRLPSLDELIALAGESDERYADDINCTFVRDPFMFNLKLHQSQSVGSLIQEFLQYYQEFDFCSYGISICSGRAIPKPDSSPLYIVNPLERTLNVSKNVSIGEVENIRMNIRDLLWKLETQQKLATLIKPTKSKTGVNKYVPRLVSVKDLFVDR